MAAEPGNPSAHVRIGDETPAREDNGRVRRTSGLASVALVAGLAAVATVAGAAAAPAVRHVFVIAMENHDARQIYGNGDEAPFIQSLLADAAHATNFVDELPRLASEPHYIWMEAGTNAFADHTFTTDDRPSASNSTASRDHLVAQVADAPDLDWKAYQEGQTRRAGACPISKHGRYHPKHNPFVFFQDVSGNPPSKDNAYCAEHIRPYSALAADLAADTVASYVFITPDLCNDMHGALGCLGSSVKRGDAWLKRELPALIAWADAHQGAIFLTWDEGDDTQRVPFLAIGPRVKRGYAGDVRYDHGSMVKSVEELLGLPVLPAVAGANDLRDLFEPGTFP